MTQYPAPYSPPPLGYAQQTYWDPHRDMLAPARRASVFMFVYGALMMLCGSCQLASAFMRSPETVRRVQEMFPGMTLPTERETMTISSILLGAAVLFVILGIWVRNGRRSSLIATIIVVSLILAYRFISLLLGLLTGGNPTVLAGALCVDIVVIVGPMSLLLVWLVQALRNSPHLDGAQAYAQQYWLYAQQYQQGYSQPGYVQPPSAPPMPHEQEGMMIPAPPPPLAPPPPPSSPPETPS